MTKERLWVAVLDRAPAAADAVAPLHDVDGVPAGHLVAWKQSSKPIRDARRADPRILDGSGRAGWVSLTWPDRDDLLPFDDLAVQQVRRVVLADARPVDLVTTLLVDDSRFAGSLSLRRGRDAHQRLAEDPFARIASARLLHVGPGLLGDVPPAAGPVIERHGSAVPWPGGTFAARVHGRSSER